MIATRAFAFAFAFAPAVPHLARARAKRTLCAPRAAIGMDLNASPAPTHSADALMSLFRAVIPSLDASAHKGQNGRICVLGGSADYTGAPYYASMSALRAGADLAIVLCPPDAAPALKGLSPELVVPACGLNADLDMIENMHALVIGPGLGRAEEAGAAVLRFVTVAIKTGTPVVLDADALWFLARSQDLRDVVRNAPDDAFVLATPNAPELRRLREAVGAKCDAEVLACFQGRLTLLNKGAEDVVCAGSVRALVANPGSRKRCGGLGDVVAGIAGLFAFWTAQAIRQNRVSGSISEYRAAAAVAAAAVARRASHYAFQKRMRSLVASDVLHEIGCTVLELEHGILRAA